MHLGNQNKTTKDNGSLYRIGLLGLIVAAALFLQACGSSSTPSLVQLHSSFKSNELEQGTHKKRRFGVQISPPKKHKKSSELMYLSLPMDFITTLGLKNTLFSLNAHASFSHILSASLSLGYYNYVQLHIWGGLLGKSTLLGVTTNPYAGLIAGVAFGKTSVYKEIYHPTHIAVGGNEWRAVERENRFRYELAYQFWEYGLPSISYEHSPDYSFECWGINYSIPFSSFNLLKNNMTED